ncbi:MAG: HPF/RaiA family ribosome-associated protein [Geminicoccaceae bacterium]|nr:MAG: HPF/RaiA family ribosome-associated protein [Geminicoccaceae bacterium]
MQIQINTDKNIEGREKLAAWITGEIETRLARFGRHVTRIEVHLSDQSGVQKAVGSDKRCVIEARLEGRQPDAVSNDAASVEAAFAGALTKLRNALATTLGQLQDRSRQPAQREG